jgi:hypothetical protein
MIDSMADRILIKCDVIERNQLLIYEKLNSIEESLKKLARPPVVISRGHVCLNCGKRITKAGFCCIACTLAYAEKLVTEDKKKETDK